LVEVVTAKRYISVIIAIGSLKSKIQMNDLTHQMSEASIQINNWMELARSAI